MNIEQLKIALISGAPVIWHHQKTAKPYKAEYVRVKEIIYQMQAGRKLKIIAVLEDRNGNSVIRVDPKDIYFKFQEGEPNEQPK